MQSEITHLRAFSLDEVPRLTPKPSRTVQGCLEYIWRVFRLRARLFLFQEGALVLRYCAGAYRLCPDIGARVPPGSVVWKIFREGVPVNLTDREDQPRESHTLPEPVVCKAVIPLKCSDVLPCKGTDAFGVLVVDAVDMGRSLDEQEFQYLEVFAMLLSEVLARSILLERIRTMQREKTQMAEEVCHIFRNRFMVIGGLALRLTKILQDPPLRQYARIILKETAKAEKALRRWKKLHRKGEWEDEPGYFC
jgi:hypothetical protein